VRKHADDTTQTIFSKITNGAASSDLFRALYLFHTGETWIDCDLPAVKLSFDGDRTRSLRIFDVGFSVSILVV
jgi:hypothetical protein